MVSAPAPRANTSVKNMVASQLLRTLRTESSPIQRKSSEFAGEGRPLPRVGHSGVHKQLKKHFIDKPKVNGRGETSAILTDVNGWRKVLEQALVFHAIIHEHHNLEPSIQTDRARFSSKITEAMSGMINGFYRGDNSVDTGTCKVHSHMHLPKDCFEYGSPMNYDAALGERGLKFWAKAPSRTAMKCGETTFITQTSSRVSDHQLLSKAYRKMSDTASFHETSNAAIHPTHKRWSFTRKNCHMQYDLSAELVATMEAGSNIPHFESPHC